MKKATIMALLLAAFAPLTQAWATTYYYKLHLEVSSASTGSGLVYAATSNSDSGATYKSSSDATPSGGANNQDVSTGYAFAKADYGSVFKGWATENETTTTISSDNPYNIPTVLATGTSANQADPTKNYYAVFEKNTAHTVNLITPALSDGFIDYKVTGPTGFTGVSLSTDGEIEVYTGESYNFNCSVAEGYEFIKWTVNGADVGSSATLTKSFSSASTVQAVLNKLETYYATCQAVPAGCSYKVGSAVVSADEYQTSGYGTLTVNLSAPTAASGYMFAGWYEIMDGEKTVISTDASTTVTKKSDVTLGADFVAITAPVMLATSTGSVDYNNLDDAFAAAKPGDSISVFSDSAINGDVVVHKGSTLNIAVGVTVTLNGTLAVAGTIAGSGTLVGSGTLYKISYFIDQSDVITIKTAYGKECDHLNFAADAHYNKMPRYCRTTVTKNTPTIGTSVSVPSDMQSWGVLLNGTSAYKITTQNPKAVKVSFDATQENGYQKSVNRITGVTDTVTSTELGATGNYVLFADCTLTGPLESSKLANQSVIDCAGRQIKATKNTHYKFCTLCLNGTVYFSASQWQNAKAAFFNCTSIEIYGIKGVSPSYAFYDCGTVESPASVKFNYYKSDYSTTGDASASNHKTAYFYSGVYEYGFNDTNDGSDYSFVYGGSFKTKPIGVPTQPDDSGVEIEAASPADNGTKYWVVQKKGAAQNVASMGDTPYRSLALAINAAQNSGSVITLTDNARIDNESVVIPPTKNIIISLNGYAIIGGTIVNNGTLLLTDKETGNCNTVMSQSGGTVSSEIENNGTLDIAWGTYSGAIANKVGGTLTVHNGRFEGGIDNSGGSVALKGGHFMKSVYSEASLAALGLGANCKICTAVEQGVSVDCFSIFEEPNGDMVYSNGAYSVTPYIDGDYNLLEGWTKESKNSYADYSPNINNWTRLAELLSFYQIFNGKIIDAVLVADRSIAAGTLKCTGVLNNNLNYPLTIEQQMDVGVTNYVLSAAVVKKGYTAIAYKYIFTHEVGAIKTIGLKVAVNGDNGPANNGTVCEVLIDFWNSTRAPDYHDPDNKHMLTNTLYVAAKKRFTIGAGSNVAMIRPETGAAKFYATVDAAVDAVEEGGTVMLANDCSGNVTVGKACTIDTNGFAFTGNVAADEDYEIDASADGVYVVTAKVIDPVTKVDVETVVAQVVSDEWLEANEISTENKTPEEIQAAVQEVLSEPDDNGNAKWENLVLGQDSETKPAIEASTGGTETTAMIEVSFEVPKDETTGEAIDTGYKVKYAFDKVDIATGDVVENGAGEAQDTPQLDLKGVTAKDGPSYFQMRAVLESNDGKTTSEVEVEKTIGVMKVESAAEYTIIAVPWKSLGDGNVTAAELVHAASLQTGDELIAYSDDGTPNKWTVKNGEWVPETEYTLDEDEPEAGATIDPATVKLARGQGVWLKRNNPESPIYLVGQPSDEPIETPLAAANDSGSSWNLVASPSVEPIDVAEVLAANDEDDKNDRVVVPRGGNAVPKNFHYNAKKNAWGYDSTEVVYDGEDAVGVRTVFVTDDSTVPAGTGFWYLNSSKDSNKTITWGNN